MFRMKSILMTFMQTKKEYSGLKAEVLIPGEMIRMIHISNMPGYKLPWRPSLKKNCRKWKWQLDIIRIARGYSDMRIKFSMRV
jgi:hypothetical protein